MMDEKTKKIWGGIYEDAKPKNRDERRARFRKRVESVIARRVFEPHGEPVPRQPFPRKATKRTLRRKGIVRGYPAHSAPREKVRVHRPEKKLVNGKWVLHEWSNDKGMYVRAQ